MSTLVMHLHAQKQRLKGHVQWHVLEEEEERLEMEIKKLRRKKELVEIDAEIAVANAKLFVLESEGNCKDIQSGGMNSYCSRQLKLNSANNSSHPRATSVMLHQQQTSLSHTPQPEERLQSLNQEAVNQEVPHQLPTSTSYKPERNTGLHSQRDFIPQNSQPVDPSHGLDRTGYWKYFATAKPSNNPNAAKATSSFSSP